MRYARYATILGMMAVGAIALGARRGPAAPVQARTVTVYKAPTCPCCSGWVRHAQRAGFTVVLRDTLAEALPAVARRLGVPDSIPSCHTSVVGGYVVQGHVPIAAVERLLAERPKIVGIGVAYMPLGSPGMEAGGRTEPFDVIAFKRDSSWVYSRHGAR